MAGTGSITVDLKGSIGTTPATCNGAGTQSTSGPTFRLELPASLRSATNDGFATVRTISSPGALDGIDFPSNLRATVFYAKVQTISPMLIELTYETTGVVVLPLFGPMLITTPTDDRISLVRVQGQGDIEWLAAGGIV